MINKSLNKSASAIADGRSALAMVANLRETDNYTEFSDFATEFLLDMTPNWEEVGLDRDHRDILVAFAADFAAEAFGEVLEEDDMSADSLWNEIAPVLDGTDGGDDAIALITAALMNNSSGGQDNFLFAAAEKVQHHVDALLALTMFTTACFEQLAQIHGLPLDEYLWETVLYYNKEFGGDIKFPKPM